MNTILRLNRKIFIEYSKANNEDITKVEYQESVTELIIQLKIIANLMIIFANLSSNGGIPYNHPQTPQADSKSFPYTFDFTFDS